MADRVEFDASEVFRLAASLGRAGAVAGAKAYKVVSHHGLKLQARVKANAAGRPGPRQISGDYNRSISLEVGIDGGGPTARVGTNRPQGRRLEFGFTGTDSLGRRYNQPPYPHFGPAVDEVAPGFEADVAGIAGTIGLG